MPNYKEVYISLDDFEVLQGLERHYEGFVVGLGYAFKHSFSIPPTTFNGYTNSNLPSQADRFTLIQGQFVDNSPEAIERSLTGFIKPSVIHTVQSGDTLGDLAQRYHVSVDDLIKWNGLHNPDRIDVGQRLIVSQASIAITSVSERVREIYKQLTDSTPNSMESKSKRREVPVSTIIASGAAGIKELHYSDLFETWMGKNGDIYSQAWGGNGATGGKYKFARNASNHWGFSVLGKGIGAYNAFSLAKKLHDEEINETQFVIEGASNLYSTIGGIYGAAWGIGWELGRLISYTKPYQEFKFNMWYKSTERIYGPPCERNEHLWRLAYQNYMP